MNKIALFFLVATAVGGVIWVFVYPILSGERKAEQRKRIVAKSAPAVRAAAAARSTQKSRREQIEGSLRDIEARRSKSVPLALRLAHAGLHWSKHQFIMFCAALGVAAFLACFFIGTGLIAALAMSFAASCGLPFWILRFLKKRREAKFIEGLADAVDIIVRGVKAGLPLLDSLKVISTDAPEPVKSEFRSIIETQAIGMPIGEACCKLYESVPVPEANFFGIVVAIQQKSGGNLSEALGNLSKVLRERKKMRAKIQARSMEAKASAGIIGSLPFAVMFLVYITSPQYIELLWTHPTGHVMLACSAVWMSMGVFVMRKMINFDF